MASYDVLYEHGDLVAHGRGGIGGLGGGGANQMVDHNLVREKRLAARAKVYPKP
jgi:hypothetical protein